MTLYSSASLLVSLSALCVVPVVAYAQFAEDERAVPDFASPGAVWIGGRGGVVSTTPRGTFPSLIVGEGEQQRGSGEIEQQFAETGLGSRFGASALIPFSDRIGLSAELGLLHYVARYKGDTGRLATRFDVQTLQLAAGLQGSIFSDPRSFRGAGLRSVYVDGGFDVTVATLANRLESSTYADSLATTPVPATGSFASSEPFRNTVALRGALGIRFALETHLELLAEASYSYALNAIFSGDVVSDNDFTADHLTFLVGIGYRF